MFISLFMHWLINNINHFMELLDWNKNHIGRNCDKIHSETPPKEKILLVWMTFFWKGSKVRCKSSPGYTWKNKGQCFGNVGKEIHLPTKDWSNWELVSKVKWSAVSNSELIKSNFITIQVSQIFEWYSPRKVCHS